MTITAQSVLPASLWAATACQAPAYQGMPRHRTVDAAVVGGGYTGLNTALHLAQRGIETCLVEASEPGWGASGRNGGQIIAGLKYLPDDLERLFGPRLGPALVGAMSGSAQLVRALVERYGIDCQASFKGWLQAAHGSAAMDQTVRPRAAQWKARGVETRLLNGSDVSAMVGSPEHLYVGGWFDPRCGVLQPLSYARGLAEAAIAEGVAIYPFNPVRQLERDGERWVLQTDGGTIKANRVVLATNAYTDDLWPGLRQTVVPVTSFQIATYPLDATVRDTITPGGQGVTDTRRLLNYFRLDPQGRLVMGGRSPVDDNPVMKDTTALRASIAKTFPQAAEAPIEFLWSGKVALTKDTLPHVHLLAPNLFAALGCNGRGVAICTMTGKIMADFVAGAAADDIALPVTVPDAFAMHWLRSVGVLLASHYYRLLDWLEARPASHANTATRTALS